MTVQTTRLLVRVQARGGKFLADDIGGSQVTVHDAHTGELLGGGLARGTSSGELTATYAPSASQNAVITPASTLGPQMINWLVAAPSGAPPASSLTLDLPIVQPTLLAVTAYGPVGGLQSVQRVTTTTWMVPGSPITQGPGLVVEMPGLLVQVLQPPTHDFVNVASFNVKVTMMCGCEIALKPRWYWVPEDFAVSVEIFDVANPEVKLDGYSLTFQQTPDGKGLFSGNRPLPARQSYYRAVVTAVQKSTGNVGTATVTLFNVPPAG